MGFEVNQIQELLGKTFIEVKRNTVSELIFIAETGEKYRFYHDQD